MASKTRATKAASPIKMQKAINLGYCSTAEPLSKDMAKKAPDKFSKHCTPRLSKIAYATVKSADTAIFVHLFAPAV